MANIIQFTTSQYESIWRHLLQTDREQIAFAFAETAATQEELLFRAADVYLVPPDELNAQHAWHVSLTDESQGKIIKLAWDMRLALVELHSHLEFRHPTQFSSTDLAGLGEFVPHVRWRLRGKPYLAIVVGPNDFDALVWRDGDAEALDQLHVDDHVLTPTNATLEDMTSYWPVRHA